MASENTVSRKSFKVWREKSEVLRASAELRKCRVDLELANLCFLLMSGKQIKPADLQDSTLNKETLFTKGKPDLLLDIPEVELETQVDTVKFISKSFDGGKSYHFYEPQDFDKYLEPNLTVDSFFRTILPTHLDIKKSVSGKRFTPVTIILPTAKPDVNDCEAEADSTNKVVTSSWKHLVVQPEVFKFVDNPPKGKNSSSAKNENIDEVNKIAFAQRVSALFVLLNMSSLRIGQTNKSNLFEELHQAHCVLRDKIKIEGRDLRIDELPKSCFRYSVPYGINEELQKLKYKHKYNFKHLQLLKSRENDPDCTWRDTDKLSSGLANLAVLTSGTAITFYVESDLEDKASKNFPPCAYLVAPEIIHNMFLDMRDFCPEMNKYYTCIA